MIINVKKFYKRGASALFLTLLVNSITTSTNATYREKISFWDTQQQGANIFNNTVTVEDLQAAKKYGIKFIRLAPDKFTSTHRDFLLGDADDYQGLIKEDLEKLKSTLDICHQEGLPVVVTMLSLPGSRWKQNNQNKDDLRVWREEKYQLQAARFWQDLAAAFKNHPAIVGYNILNEPHPERIFQPQEVHLHAVHQEEVQQMLYAFYSRIIKSIRLSDEHTPIILDSSAYADPKTFDLLKPHEDKKILYSFHMYEPYEYTNHEMNKGKFLYPGTIEGKQWDQGALKKYMSSVVTFQKMHTIPSNKILVGEFGGHRMSPNLEKYFQDLIGLFTKESWHFAFYAFREDTWDGMDYELGNEKLPWSYWQALERNEKPNVNRKDTHAAFSILKKSLYPRN